MRRTIATMATILAVAGTSSFIVVQSKEEPAKIADSQSDRSDIRASRSETRQPIADIEQMANDKLDNQKAMAEKKAKELLEAEKRAQEKKAREIAEAKAERERQAALAAAAEEARKRRQENSKPVVIKPKVTQPTYNHVAPGGIAACIRKYESGGNYTAQNPSSTASGAYQFLDSTWQGVTGLPGRAMNYSPATQDAAFWKLWDNGRGASQWVTAGMCGY